MNILGDICIYCYKNCTSQVNGLIFPNSVQMSAGHFIQM